MHADQIGCMNLGRTTQLTLVLGGFLGEDVALKRHGAFDGATTAWLEPLSGATLGFHLWHVLPFDYFAAAGGGTFPRFEPEVDLFAQFCYRSRALLKINVSFLDQPSSPSDGLPFSGTVRLAPIPSNPLPPVLITPCPIPGAPFHVPENAV